MEKFKKSNCIGKAIKDISLYNNYVVINFTDGSSLELEASNYTDYGIDGKFEEIEITACFKDFK